ncbi:hypothetical protein [Dyella choica]|uniref:Uncharacterized protein n=1 Tax=Dyella choica TaxID=1927959 RepID=A0A3S0Q1Q6_9GAMM|nr:hypothetical protein [Dyella choica]RUL69005.1 hypothetical protein EKH80_23035 [Dyella choica]
MKVIEVAATDLRARHALNGEPFDFCVSADASGKRRLEVADELRMDTANGSDKPSDVLLYALPQEGHCQSAT